MIANLRNYEPETIEFVVPDSIREKFPPVLFQGSTNVDELIKLVNEHFNATFPESEVTQRLLDEFEISEIREEYCIKQENEVPKRERELLEAIERAKKIKLLEQRVYSEHQTQLFIETPYRNNKMVEDILNNCRPQTRLCIAANITCEGEYIRTRTVKEWKGHLPELSKIPCIFLLYQ